MSRTGNGKLLVSGNGIPMVSDTGPFTTFTLEIGRTGVGPRGPEAPDTNVGPTLHLNSCAVRVPKNACFSKESTRKMLIDAHLHSRKDVATFRL